MKTPVVRELRLLHLEDSDLDHVLLLAHLHRGGLRVQATRVDSESEFLAAIQKDWDAIVSDYNLPGFSGLLALDLLKASRRDIPFVIVSGEIGEEIAVEAMRNGASDYVRKGNLARLVPALLNAIEASVTRREKERSEAELNASKQRLSELAQHLQGSIEQERAAIARELHDDVGGSLTALKFDLAWIARHPESDEVPVRVGAALEQVSHAIEAAQRIMHNLRPAILEQGLVAALQWIAGRFEKRTGVACLLRTPEKIPELPNGVGLVAYRTVQEALTNVTKYAQATQVAIDLSSAGKVISLEVSDNGRGFLQSDLAKPQSFGIRGLHERARTVGGWIDLSSSPSGTTLILSVPLHGAAATGAALRARSKSADPSHWGDL
ncbi:MAG: histidine kinase [Burkholderiaceae bacterium]